MTSPTSPGASGGLDLLERPKEVEEATAEKPWECRLHNDPVNTIHYVIRTLRKVLKCDPATAERYTMIAHLEGFAIVTEGSQDQCQKIAGQLTYHTLWATVRKKR